MADPLSNIYESILLQEMRQEVANYINRHNYSNHPFEHIFEGKTRIAIPVLQDKGASAFLNAVYTIPNLAKFDPDTLMGEIVTALDPKYGKGDTKTQQVNIGKLIHKMRVSDKEKQEYLNWFAKYKDSIKDELKKSIESSKYTIILSRSPIDVGRMSDTDNIGSCHSPGKDRYHHAITDAVVGAAIAYLVKTKSLKDIDTESEEFQKKEMFSDKDRWDDGLGLNHPVARIRLRRFVSADGEQEIALPEVRVYGHDVLSSFYPTLRDFLQDKQHLTLPMAKEIFQQGSGWVRVAARYRDGGSNLVAMLSRYFGLGDNDPRYSDIMNAYIDYDDKSQSESHDTEDFIHERENPHQALYDQLERDLASRLNRFRYQETGIKPIYIDYNLDMDDDDIGPYYTAYGTVTFLVPLPDELGDGSTMDMYDVERQGGKLSVLVDHLKGIFEEWSLEMSNIYTDTDHSRLTVTFNMDGPSISTDDRDFDEFADNMVGMRDAYEPLLTTVKTLIDMVYNDGSNQYRRYMEADDDEWTYVSLDTPNSPTFSLEMNLVFANKGTNFISDYPIIRGVFPATWFRFRTILKNYVTANMRIIPSTADQTTFGGFFESYNEEQSRIEEFPLNITGEVKLDLDPSGQYLLLTLQITPTDYTNTTFQIIDFIDANVEDIRKLLYLHVYENCMLGFGLNPEGLRDQFIRSFRIGNIDAYMRVFDKYLDNKYRDLG